MSVIVLGMEMPKSCESCGVTCELWARHKVGQRHPDCSLRPLPNVHGDLIDRDALSSRVEWEDIVNAPAIVGAEGKEPIKITGKIYFVDGHVYIDLDKEDKP